MGAVWTRWRNNCGGLYRAGRSYFRLAQTPKVFRELDEWLPHRLRALQLKQWRRPLTIFRAVRALGGTVDQAAKAASTAGGWWNGSRVLLNAVLPIAYFDRLGVPRLA